jgi:hypothetical protein
MQDKQRGDMRGVVFSFAFLALFTMTSPGQSVSLAPYESDILSARPIRTWLGLGVGSYGYWHQGSFSPNCDCDFGGESGWSPMFALDISRDYPKLGFAIRGLITYYDVSSLFMYEETRRSVLVGDDQDREIRYQKSSDVVLRYLTFTPSFAWYIPRSRVYVQAGLELGLPLKYRYNNVERILTEGVTYYDDLTEYVLLEESDIPGGKSIRLALALGAGVDVQISSAIMITPQIGFNLPLTDVSSTDTWSVNTAYGLLFLKIRLW